MDHKPIYERVADLQREKRLRMKELKRECDTEKLGGLTFVPQIDARSRRMAERRLEEGAGGERGRVGPGAGQGSGQGAGQGSGHGSGSGLGVDVDVSVSVSGCGDSGEASPDSLADVSTRLYHDAHRAEVR